MEPTDYKNIEDLLKTLQKNSTSLDNSQITLDSLMADIQKYIKDVQYEMDGKKDEPILTINNIDKFLNNTVNYVTLKEWKVDVSEYVFEVSVDGMFGTKIVTLKRKLNDNNNCYRLECKQTNTGVWISKDKLKNPNDFFREIRYIVEDLPF